MILWRVDELPGGNDRDPPPVAIRSGEPLVLQRLERGGCPLAGGDVPLGRIRGQPADQVVAQPVGQGGIRCGWLQGSARRRDSLNPGERSAPMTRWLDLAFQPAYHRSQWTIVSSGWRAAGLKSVPTV